MKHFPEVHPHHAGIYLHIPFCKQACHYCNFHFSTSTRYKAAMLAAMKRELTLRRSYLGKAIIETIYFGGGTPSLLAAEEVRDLLDHIYKLFPCAARMEITLEGNPDDLTRDYMEGLKAAGVGRLSIGIQSLDDEVLHALHRAHSAKEAVTCVRDARKVGLSNFSIDLMYGLPARKAGGWEEELKEAVRLAPPHISAYCLTIEPNTVFGHRRAKGTFAPVSEEAEVAEFELLTSTLHAEGYVHYEIANFCLPSYHAQHNTHYWQRVPYLGVGPSAHSYNGKTRQYNVAHNKAYIDAISRGEVPCRQEVLSSTEHINEHIMLGLRTMWGVDTAWLFKAYGYDLVQTKAQPIDLAVAQGLMVKEVDRLLLTPQGQLVADALAQELFAETGRP